MLKMMGYLNVEDVLRLIVVVLGSFLIYAIYKKCDKNNKKIKVIFKVLAIVALITILKSFYCGTFNLCGLDYFSNAAIVVILHLIVYTATSQLCCKGKKEKSHSHTDPCTESSHTDPCTESDNHSKKSDSCKSSTHLKKSDCESSSFSNTDWCNPSSSSDDDCSHTCSSSRTSWPSCNDSKDSKDSKDCNHCKKSSKTSSCSW